MASTRRRSLQAVGHKLAEILELPKEVFFDLPRVVVIGNLHVSVENHHGLLAYDGDSLALAMSSGRMVVWGEGLTVGMVGPNELTVTGKIAGVRFETKGEGG